MEFPFSPVANIVNCIIITRAIHCFLTTSIIHIKINFGTEKTDY